MMYPRSSVLIGYLLLACVVVRAEDTAVLLARADQAFAASDYKTALEIYKSLDGKLTDAAQADMMKERMRVASRALSGVPAPAPATRPAQRVPHEKPKDGQILEIGLHDLGNFDFSEDNDSTLPDDVRALNGCKAKIPGQMMPLDQAGKVTRFILVNDLMSCCFGSAPKIQHVAYIQMPEGKWIEPTSERITVEGTLKVRIKREDGFVTSIFELEPTSIKYAPQ